MTADVTLIWMDKGHAEDAHRNAERQMAEGRAAYLAGEGFHDFMPTFWQNGWTDARDNMRPAMRLTLPELAGAVT